MNSGDCQKKSTCPSRPSPIQWVSLSLVAAREAREKSEHPLQRIIAVRDVASGVQVSTTDVHLARGIAHAVHDAFKGDLDLSYSKDEDLLRANWSR